MSRFADTPAIAIQVSRGVVVATIQVDLEETVLTRFRDDLLLRVQKTNSTWVFFDFSGLEILDPWEFSTLRDIIRMCTIMGTRTILVGLRPGVVSSLVEAGADLDGLQAATDLDAAYEQLEEASKANVEPASKIPGAPR